MLRKGKLSRKLIKSVILILCVSSGLILNSCVSYNPSLYVTENVLNPNEEVKKCPLGWIEDGKIVNDAGEEIFIERGVIINEAFSQWVVDLKNAVKELLKLVK